MHYQWFSPWLNTFRLGIRFVRLWSGNCRSFQISNGMILTFLSFTYFLSLQGIVTGYLYILQVNPSTFVVLLPSLNSISLNRVCNHLIQFLYLMWVYLNNGYWLIGILFSTPIVCWPIKSGCRSIPCGLLKYIKQLATVVLL